MVSETEVKIKNRLKKNADSPQPVGKIAEGRGRPRNPKTMTGIETLSKEWPTPTPAKKWIFEIRREKKWTEVIVTMILKYFYYMPDKRCTVHSLRNKFLLRNMVHVRTRV